MNNQYKFFEKQSISPILDRNYRPAVIENKRFIQYVSFRRIIKSKCC